MKKVLVEESIGMILGHDLTQIIPGQFKGPKFKKGHMVKAEDIPILKSMGKDHIYILELTEGILHENEAAIRIAQATAGVGLRLTEPSEGKVSYVAESDGMLDIDVERLNAINGIEYVVLATLHTGRLVKTGQVVAATRINPLVIEEDPICQVEEIGARDGKILNIIPQKSLKVGVIITGNEVYYGRIEDRFGPIFVEKFNEYGVELQELTYAADDPIKIKEAILDLKKIGVDVIVTGGGMSVDPDDVTPEGIRQTGAEIVKYGAPVLPGAMFLLAYLDNIPVVGVPACAMFHKITIFDIIFPYILVGKKVEVEDIIKLGHGGLCLNCQVCHYPDCPLGKA